MSKKKMTNYHNIDVLRDVLCLLHPDTLNHIRGAGGQKENEERQKRLTAWLEHLKELVSYKDAPWDMEDGGARGCKVDIVPRFIDVLRECMLFHRWPQVLQILDCLAHIPEKTDWVVWKAGLTVLYTEPDVNCELIQQFFKQMYLLRELNLRDVVLEFVQYLLTQGLTQEATQVIQESHKIRRGVQKKSQAKYTRHLCDLLDAYQGMIFYVDWRYAIFRSTAAQQPASSESFYDLTQPVAGLSDDAIKQIATRALLALDQLPDKDGVWDIFLPKAVEIHEYYKEFEKARKLLDRYCKKNPDNPNSHHFLYEFLQRNSKHFRYEENAVQEKLIGCLKGLVKLDPTNPLAITLCNMLAEAGHGEAVVYIFDLLDFDVWKDQPSGWDWLSNHLQQLLSRDEGTVKKESLDYMERCWSIRKDWWPSYHFTTNSMSCESSESRNLLLTKCIVASVLLGKDCEFCQEARELMKKKRVQRLDKVLSDMHLEVFQPVKTPTPRKRRKTADSACYNSLQTASSGQCL